jgi:hypothetical protein
MAVIQPFVTNIVLQHYKALTLFKVGAIRSRGVESQYDLVGSLHSDFDDNVNKKVPEERPQSIILALDPFKLLYETDTGSGGLTDGNIKELHVKRGQAMVFTVLFIILVDQITQMTQQVMYIDYLRILFRQNQIILQSLELGSSIEP